MARNTPAQQTMGKGVHPLAGLFQGAVSTDDRDPEVVAAEIAQRILDADTIDDIFAVGGGEVLSARDVLDEPFTFDSVKFNESDLAGSLGAYAICYVRYLRGMHKGESAVVSCGATNVMAQLYKLHQMNAFPIDLKFVEGKETQRGYHPLWLARVDEQDREF